MEEQRECKTCNEIKDVKTGYYPNRNECIDCVRQKESIYRRKASLQYKIENGGSERVPQTPGVYADKYQEQQVKEFLTAIGWKLNPNGVWSKKGFKDENKKFLKPIKKYKRPNPSHSNGSVRSPVYLKRLELVELREKGFTYNKIGDIYGISPATVLRIIRDDYTKLDEE
jgi:hypothetical protein